jgi:hypothetical protein
VNVAGEPTAGVGSAVPVGGADNVNAVWPTFITTPLEVLVVKLESEGVKVAVIVWAPVEVNAWEQVTGDTAPAATLVVQNVPEAAKSLKLIVPDGSTVPV